MIRAASMHRLAPAALAVAFVGALPALAQEGPDFMPKGGKTLFVEVFGVAPDAATIGEMSGAARSEADWSGLLTGRSTILNETEIRTLAAYLAVNLPLQRDALEAAAKAGDISSALPADGRELAWTGCQSCHSLFAGFLTQDRDLQGWQNMFQSPFHRELQMTPQQREEFSHYSAINMPMKIEDVPEDLRF